MKIPKWFSFTFIVVTILVITILQLRTREWEKKQPWPGHFVNYHGKTHEIEAAAYDPKTGKYTLQFMNANNKTPADSVQVIYKPLWTELQDKLLGTPQQREIRRKINSN